MSIPIQIYGKVDPETLEATVHLQFVDAGITVILGNDEAIRVGYLLVEMGQRVTSEAEMYRFMRHVIDASWAGETRNAPGRNIARGVADQFALWWRRWRARGGCQGDDPALTCDHKRVPAAEQRDNDGIPEVFKQGW